MSRGHRGQRRARGLSLASAPSRPQARGPLRRERGLPRVPTPPPRPVPSRTCQHGQRGHQHHGPHRPSRGGWRQRHWENEGGRSRRITTGVGGAHRSMRTRLPPPPSLWAAVAGGADVERRHRGGAERGGIVESQNHRKTESPE